MPDLPGEDAPSSGDGASTFHSTTVTIRLPGKASSRIQGDQANRIRSLEILPVTYTATVAQHEFRSPDSARVLERVFASYDKDQSGTIDRAEFTCVLRDLGWGAECESVFAGLDENGTGCITMTQFLGWHAHAFSARVLCGYPRKAESPLSDWETTRELTSLGDSLVSSASRSGIGLDECEVPMPMTPAALRLRMISRAVVEDEIVAADEIDGLGRGTDK
jgi:hypothetical protein